MARYRTKDEIDLAWNKTRRRITRDLDTMIQDFREEILNEALGDAWTKFSKALETGDTIQLEDEASKWVDDIISRRLRPVIEAHVGDVADA